MPSTRQLKGRIRSVKSTKQITKAMQMVAASKMRRSQEATKASAPYTQVANELLAYLAGQGITDDHPYFKTRPVKARLLIVIASDKGLAGAFNTNVFKAYIQALREDDVAGIKNVTITVGRKAAQFVTRLKDTEIAGTYENVADVPTEAEFHAILNTASDMFTEGHVDAVDLIYTEFISSINQQPKIQRLLPAGIAKTQVSETIRDAAYEPDLSTVLRWVAFRLVGAQLYQAFLDSRASEHSMRMIAMKNATDNASDLVEDLTLAMNKARQGAITQELSEISAGVEAMK